ncbi:hypothetical protein N9K12_04850 [Methylophilaceae bacterium]|jgi:cytochrome oxidase Cu insertion factor (SCO1/SenC/PrrC family)|nr:hypothetical protein [Betaproteobacteria bacterium]MDA9086120.1 hypothetical protein [Methylophilaceae bacterium]MCH9842289.1 hypothetical protein [Betaproteobacteria bacterium]MDC0115436.1 hypothetical protein [Methylophilaceae bacterium]MDC0128234.1 hypothetical protein [Methylophilaceae bacterium]
MISQQNKGRLVLVTIALMFFLPILLAWFLNFYSDFKRDAQGIHHGELIVPPLPLGDLKVTAIGASEVLSLEKKWTLIFLVSNQCDLTCEDKLYQLRQIRLAVGKDRDKVERVLVVDKELDWSDYENSFQNQKVIVKGSPSYESIIKNLKSVKNFDSNAIYLMDAYGSLIMKYAYKTAPKGIIKDIERLIRVAP